jgi:hypothetical protein
MTQLACEKSRYVEYHPQTSVDRDAPLEFTIYSSTEYIDPSNVILYIKSKILAGNGGTLPERTSQTNATIPNRSFVWPINYINGTRFKSVEVYLCGHKISESDFLYPYKSYLQVLLSYSDETKYGELSAGGWFKDTVPEGATFDDNGNNMAEEDAVVNEGCKSRFNWTKFSRGFETFGRIHSEIFEQPRFILPGCELKIRLIRSDATFCLMSHSDLKYSIPIQEATLYVRQVAVTDSVREAHELCLLKMNAKYPVKRLSLKFFTNGPNRDNLSQHSLCKGTLPTKVILCFVDSAAFAGCHDKSPLNLQHMNISSIALKKNGEALPFSELKMDYSNNQYLLAYLSMLQGTNRLYSDSSNGIEPPDFKKGYAVYCFNLSPDMSNGSSLDVVESGTLSEEISLDQTNTFSVTMIALLEFDSVIQITSSKSVIYDV